MIMEGFGLKRKLLLLLLNISIASLIGLAGCGGYEQRAEAYYSEGMEEFRQEDFDAAGRNFKLVTLSFKNSPYAESAQSYIRLCEAGGIAVKARDFFFMGNLMEARRLAELAMEKGKHLPAVLFINGLVSYKMGQMDQAASLFERLKEEENAGDYIALAIAAGHIVYQRYGKAQEMLLRVFDQTDIRSIKELALNALLMDRLSAPVEGARNLVSLFPADHPDLALVYYVTGKSYASGEGLNYGLAEANLRKAFEIAPGAKLAADAQITLAKLLLEKPSVGEEKLIELEEALHLAQDALQYYPDNVDYQFIRNEAQRVLNLTK
jgi:tetratricopeptide (TPR) repeat protein